MTTSHPIAIAGREPGVSGQEGTDRLRVSLRDITERVSQITERPTTRSWLLTFGLVLGLALILLASLTHLVRQGIGVWGNDQNVAWAWDITSFVFWIGIGHAGTLISAVLFLFRQKWRTSVSRAAEAITLIAVATAAVYPLFHMGRVWLAYWLLPLPNQMLVWPNFKSPLSWDVFAVTSYFIVSALFWYLGLVPDLATLRDRATPGARHWILERISLGWTGSQRQYVHYEKAYLLLAGLATPLVISVHTVVSFDFAVSLVPGWHSTLFPPYFVAGAVFGGSAMVVTLMVFARSALGLQQFITLRHLEAMNKLVLVTGTMMAYCYAVEFFLATHSTDIYERATILGRFGGPYARESWLMLVCNVALPQLYWFRRIRTNIVAMVLISLGINLGMWLERFVIIVASQHRAFLPATWADFHPTVFDGSTFLGTLGLFLTLFVLFVRFVPVLSMNEVKGLTAELGTEPNRESHEQSDVNNSRRTSLLQFKSAPGLRSHQEPQGAESDSVTITGWYSDPESLAIASRQIGSVRGLMVDAHAPHSIHSVGDALRVRPSPLPYFALGAGLVGGIAAFCGQWWAEGINYPLSVGGKPPASWQAYVPITFEVTLLSAALGTFFGLWYLCGLPNLKAIPRVPALERATDSGYCLVVQTHQKRRVEVKELLRTYGATRLSEVAP
jgi:Ni/Fe-hydrogenase subunit HybB-like protein